MHKNLSLWKRLVNNLHKYVHSYYCCNNRVKDHIDLITFYIITFELLVKGISDSYFIDKSERREKKPEVILIQFYRDNRHFYDSKKNYQ